VRGASVGYLGSGGREANGPRYRAPRASRPDNLGIKCLSRTSRHERQALWCRGFPSPSGRGARRRCRAANVKHRPLRSRPRRGLTPPAATRIRAPVLRATPSGSTAPVRKSPACIPAQNTWSKSGRIRSEYIATAHHLSRCCNHRKNPRLPQRIWRDLSTPSLARYRGSQPREVLTGTTGRGYLFRSVGATYGRYGATSRQHERSRKKGSTDYDTSAHASMLGILAKKRRQHFDNISTLRFEPHGAHAHGGRPCQSCARGSRPFRVGYRSFERRAPCFMSATRLDQLRAGVGDLIQRLLAGVRMHTGDEVREDPHAPPVLDRVER